MAPSDCGHLDYLHDRIYRLHATMRANGASPAAMARLPKMPTFAQGLELKTILATRANSTQYGRQTATKTALSASKQWRNSKKAREIEIPAICSARELSDQTQRAKAIIRIVAEVAGVEEFQVAASNQEPRITAVRHLSMYLLRVLCSMTCERMGKLFHKPGRKSAQYGIRRSIFLLTITKDPHFIRLHDESLAAIRARWPGEYA